MVPCVFLTKKKKFFSLNTFVVFNPLGIPVFPTHRSKLTLDTLPTEKNIRGQK